MADEDEDDLFGNFDDDGSEEVVARELRAAKKGLIFVVDCGAEMLAEQEADQDGKKRCGLERAMEVVFLALRKRVVTDPGQSNLVGLVLYGTKENKNENGFENVVEFHPFGGIDVERLHDAKRAIKDPQAIVEKYGGSADLAEGDSALDRALWLCSFCFSGAGLKAHDERKIWLFTNNDSPDSGNAVLREKLMGRFDDLFQARQTINVWPMAKHETFDAAKFYEPALAQAKNAKRKSAEEGGNDDGGDDDGEMDVEPESGLFFTDGVAAQDLKDFVRKKDFAKRKLLPITLELGNGLSLGLDMFSLLMPATLPLPQKLDGQKLSVVRRRTEYICTATMSVLTPAKIATYCEYGVHNRVFVRPDEVRQLKRFADAGTITVVGSKPRSSLRPWYAVRAPYFVVPSDSVITGSKKLFAALLRSLVSLDWVLYAVATLRTGDAVKLVALLPRVEKVNAAGEIMDNAGFDVIVLPWANDIRKVSPVHVDTGEGSEERAPDCAPLSLVEKAEAVIKTMETLPDPTTGRVYAFQNPHIQKHYAALESVALRDAGDGDAQIEWDAAEDDETLPVLEVITSGKRKKALTAFAEAWGGMETDAEVADAEKLLKKLNASKKPAAKKKAAPPPKKKRKTKADDDDNDEDGDDDDELAELLRDFPAAREAGKLAKWTVAKLKAVCSHKGLATTGKKADIIARLEAESAEA